MPVRKTSTAWFLKPNALHKETDMPVSLYLYGSPISTYYNKVKIALIELGHPFEEIPVMPGAGHWPESGSPSGKIPYLRHGDQYVYESQAIIEYLEDIREPMAPSLFPGEVLQRAQCRELIQYIEQYLDTPMRPIYQSVFWGKEMPAGLLDKTLEDLKKGLTIVLRRTSLDPWLCSGRFTHADIAAWVHLSTIQWALAIAGHKTFFQQHAPQLGPYLQQLAERPSIERSEADRKETSRRIKAERAAAKGG